MKRVNFDARVDRRRSDSEKWNRYRGRDVIPLWVADMDFVSPQPVLDALRARVDHGIFGYGETPERLARVTTTVLKDRYGWEIEPTWLVWLPGLVTGLNVACRAVGRDGDSVLTATPIYPPFLSAPRHARREAIPVPLRQEDAGWRFDFEALERAIRPSTRLFLLCNPHNPVGRVFTRKELKTLSDLCRRRDLVICSDEIHGDLILDPNRRHLPFAGLDAETADRTITLMAPSKTFNIPGLGCAYAVIPNPKLRRGFTAAMAGIVPHVNVLGAAAALAAYESGWPWLSRLLDYLRENRDLVEMRVGRMPGLTVGHAEATYLAWIDARATGLKDPAIFFENVGVGLSDGADFAAPGFVRLNFGCPRKTLTAALDRMEKGLQMAMGPGDGKGGIDFPGGQGDNKRL